MAFWQVCVVLGALGAFFVLWPLLRKSVGQMSVGDGIDNDQTQVELYKEHLADLEKARVASDLDEKQFEELKLELQKNLIAEGIVGRTQLKSTGGKKVVLACAMLVPIIAFVLYQKWGAEKDWDIYQLLQSLDEVKTQEEYKARLRELVVDIQQRLGQKPDDVALLNLQAQLSMALQDYDQAVRAYEGILKEFPESARIIANLAQAMFYREGHVVTDKVREYTNKALALAPMLPEMHGLAGIDAKNRGDYRSAIRHWKTAVKFMDPKSASAKGYEKGIENAEKALLAAGESLDEPSSSEAAPHNLASADPEARQDTKTDASAKASIEVLVSLSENVQLAGNETLFVYARAWQGAKLPLAVQKLSASSLPLTVNLDESMSMAPGMTLTTFPKLEVIARITKSGDPIAKPGDWQASYGPLTLSEHKGPVKLEISTQLP